MNLFMGLLIFAGFVVVVGLWFISGYNQFVRLKALLQEAWSGIDVQLKRRYDLIPNLVETVKGYASHEKAVFENVAKMRAASMGATGVAAKSAAESGLTQALKSLFAVAESYPELKANENFQSLQDQLASVEEQIQLSRRYYNGTVRNYNILVQTFPSRIIATFAGFTTAPYFELNSPTERETPQIKF